VQVREKIWLMRLKGEDTEVSPRWGFSALLKHFQGAALLRYRSGALFLAFEFRAPGALVKDPVIAAFSRRYLSSAPKH
jgi:hypothetical protein